MKKGWVERQISALEPISVGWYAGMAVGCLAGLVLGVVTDVISRLVDSLTAGQVLVPVGRITAYVRDASEASMSIGAAAGSVGGVIGAVTRSRIAGLIGGLIAGAVLALALVAADSAMGARFQRSISEIIAMSAGPAAAGLGGLTAGIVRQVYDRTRPGCQPSGESSPGD